jgi:hypothetical protein
VPTGAPATLAPISTATASSTRVANGGFGVTLEIPKATSGGGSLAITGSVAAPSASSGIGAFVAGSGESLIYVSLVPSATFTLAAYPQFQLTLPPTQFPSGYNFFAAVYTNDPAFPHGYKAWYASVLGPAPATGQTLYYNTPSAVLTFMQGDTYVFCLYEVPA